eukprot:621143_1
MRRMWKKTVRPIINWRDYILCRITNVGNFANVRKRIAYLWWQPASHWEKGSLGLQMKWPLKIRSRMFPYIASFLIVDGFQSSRCYAKMLMNPDPRAIYATGCRKRAKERSLRDGTGLPYLMRKFENRYGPIPVYDNGDYSSANQTEGFSHEVHETDQDHVGDSSGIQAGQIFTRNDTGGTQDSSNTPIPWPGKVDVGGQAKGQAQINPKALAEQVYKVPPMSEKELEKKRMIKWALFLPTGVVAVALAEGICRISSPKLRKLVFWRPLIYVTLMMNMIAVDEFVARYKLITDPDPEFTHSPELRKILKRESIRAGTPLPWFLKRFEERYGPISLDGDDVRSDVESHGEE